MISDKTFTYAGYILILFFFIKGGVYLFLKGNTLAEVILWFCPFATLLLGWGLIFKNKLFISSVAVLSLAAQPIWIYEFIVFLFVGAGGGSRINFSIWFADSGLFMGWIYFILSLLQHTIVIPISLLAFLKYGMHRFTLLLSYGIILFLGILSFFFSSLKQNINCMRRPCDSSFTHNSNYGLFDSPAFYYGIEYMLIWMGIVTGMYILFMTIFFYLKKSKKH